MTLIRAVVYKIAKVVINNLVSSVIGFVIGLMKNAVRLLPIFFSAGSFILGLLDIFTDSKYDGKIAMPFKDYKLSDIRI